MAKKITGFLLGIIAGIITIGIIEAFGHFFYPIPKGFDFNNQLLLESFINELPIPALLIVIIAHSLGAFIGSLVSNYISKSVGQIGLLTSIIFLIFTIVNILMVPFHPLWFVISDILFTFIGGWIAFKIALKKKL